MNLQESIRAFLTTPIKPFEKGEDVKAYQEYFLEMYSRAFGDPTLMLMHNQHKLFKSFFRLRKLTEIQDWNDKASYGAPSPSQYTSFGRANFPNHPVFYCSPMPMTAINEMRKWNKTDAFFALSKWTKRNTEYEFKHIPTFSTRSGKEEGEAIVKRWFEGNKKDREDAILFLQFVGDQFLKENEYSVSACLAYQYLYTAKLDVVGYPSVIDFKSINFAFSPHVFSDNLLELERVYIIEFQPGEKVGLHRVGIFDHNKVSQWYDAKYLKREDEIMTTFMSDFTTNLVLH